MVVEVPKDVYEDLEQVRKSGEYNMFTEIYDGLEDFGFDSTLNWVDKNTKTYIQGFKEGIEPKE